MIPQITSTPAEFSCALKRAKAIVASWSKWKRDAPATSYPRPMPKDDVGKEKM